jgi:hypothetical protein
MLDAFLFAFTGKTLVAKAHSRHFPGSSSSWNASSVNDDQFFVRVVLAQETGDTQHEKPCSSIASRY